MQPAPGEMILLKRFQPARWSNSQMACLLYLGWGKARLGLAEPARLQPQAQGRVCPNGHPETETARVCL